MMRSTAFAGIILLNRAGAVLCANKAAQSLSATGGPLRLRQARLESVSAGHARRFDELVRAAQRGGLMDGL